MKPQFTLGAFACIKNEKNEYLLVQRRDNNKWVTPGGGIGHHESPEEACIREVKEESGFDVMVKDVSMLMSKAWDEDIVLVFDCEIVGGEPTLNDEAQAIEFFSLDNLPEPIHSRHKDILVECSKRKEKTIIKHYLEDTENDYE